MTTVAEIEHAIESLPVGEYAKLLTWIDERRTAETDMDIEGAVLAGKFDQLAERALSEIAAGETMPLEDFFCAKDVKAARP